MKKSSPNIFLLSPNHLSAWFTLPITKRMRVNFGRVLLGYIYSIKFNHIIIGKRLTDILKVFINQLFYESFHEKRKK